MRNCELCNNRASHFNILWENKDYALAFDNFGLDYSHCLLFPKRHILNLSGYFNTLYPLLRHLTDVFEHYFHQSIIVYEHGNVIENTSGNISVDHAHIHIIRCLDYSILNSIAPYDFLKTSFSEFYNKRCSRPYHFFSIGLNDSYVCYSRLYSQFFRCICANACNSEYWNWKTDGDEIKSHLLELRHDREHFSQLIKEEMSVW